MVGASRRRSLGGELQMPMNMAVSPLGGGGGEHAGRHVYLEGSTIPKYRSTLDEVGLAEGYSVKEQADSNRGLDYAAGVFHTGLRTEGLLLSACSPVCCLQYTVMSLIH
jgi:hypothetical protein